jgi:hypothetical protein
MDNDGVMVSNVTFSNISVISWRSGLLVGNPEYFQPVATKEYLYPYIKNLA